MNYTLNDGDERACWIPINSRSDGTVRGDECGLERRRPLPVYGSTVNDIRVRDIHTGEDFRTLPNGSNCPSWTKDSKAFFIEVS